MRKRHISLKGTWEYSAPRLVKDGGLAVGQDLTLRREPDCKFDRNAVRAYAGRSKLGYLPKNLSTEIAAYLDSGGHYTSTVAHLGKRSKKGKSYPSITVDLCLPGMAEHDGVDALRQAASGLKRIRGIYRISNSVEKKSYIGSSVDVGKRLTKHLNDLLNGEHGNHLLSAAWIRHRPSTFEFHLVEEVRQGCLLEREKHYISSLDTFRNGYNHSADGEGRSAAPAAKVSQLAAQAELEKDSLGLYAPSSARASSPQPPERRRPTVTHVPTQPKGSGCLVIMMLGFIAGVATLFPFLVGE